MLPVTTGQRNSIFAAANDGLVHWYDIEQNRERQSYDIGTASHKLVTGEGNRIYAVTESNSIFALSPRLGDGEHLEGKVELSSFNTSASAGDDSPVVHEEEYLIIDGLKLKKNHGSQMLRQ